jgi:hypothetical protein
MVAVVLDESSIHPISGAEIRERQSMIPSGENEAPRSLLARFRRVRPAAALAIVLLINVLWIGALAYALFILL